MLCHYMSLTHSTSSLIAAGAEDGALALLTVDGELKTLHALKHHTKTVTAVVFTPDTSLLVACSLDADVTVW